MRAVLVAMLLSGMTGCAALKQPEGDFALDRVDFGLVVRDIDESAAFYTQALGLAEVKGFHVPKGMGGDSGLSEDRAFDVRVFKTADAEDATQIKLMQFPDAPGRRIPNNFIHSAYGVRYLTIYVTDITASVERARAAGAEPLAKGPILLPEGFPKGVYLAVVRDPDGNMIELVGPKAEP